MTETMSVGGRTYDTRFFPREKTKCVSREFTEEDFRTNVLEKFRGLGRGSDRYDAFVVDCSSAETGDAGSFQSLAEMFARRVCSSRKKSVIFLIFGEVGSGKSLASLQLALHVALWIQKFKGGKVTDYFNLGNVAVITDTSMENQMLSLKKLGVYIFDDSGSSGFSSRNSMTTGNKTISSVLQVIRPLSNVLIFSCPHSALLDINAKRLSTYYSEISEIRHDEGISFLKVFRLSQDMRNGKTFHAYLQHRNMTAIRHWTSMPAPELVGVYNKVRDVQMKELVSKGTEKIEKKREKVEPKEPGRGGGTPPVAFTSVEFAKRMEEYVGKPVTITGVAGVLGIQDKTLRGYLKKNGYVWKPSKTKGKMEISRVNT